MWLTQYALLGCSLDLPSMFALAQGTSNKDDSRACFYPNGIQSIGSPCFPNRAVSPCCGPGFICLSNGLCQPGPDTRRSYDYIVYRSSCTDQAWNSTDCPQVCLGSGDSLDAGQGLATCGTGGSYCCGRGYDCCSNATDIFTYGTAETVTTIPTGSATASASATATSSPSSSNAIAIGVGVGVGVGSFAILLAIILAFLLFRQKRKAKGNQQKNQGSGPSNDEEGNPPHGSKLPTREMKNGGVSGANNSTTPQPPMYRSASHMHNHLSSPGTGGEGSSEMVPGAPLNPAEFPSGPERERYEMEGQNYGEWKGTAVRVDGQRHEMEG